MLLDDVKPRRALSWPVYERRLWSTSIAQIAMIAIPRGKNTCPAEPVKGPSNTTPAGRNASTAGYRFPANRYPIRSTIACPKAEQATGSTGGSIRRAKS